MAGRCAVMTEPYYNDDAVKLYLGDFREVLPTLGDVTFDAIVTDPPYGETSLDWDIWPDGWPQVAAQWARSMWCFGSMRMFLDRRDEFTGWRLSQDVVWEKHNGSSLAADRFSRVHEHALHFYRGPWAEIHHQTPTTPDATPRRVHRKGLPAQHQGARGASTYASVEGGPRAMRSVQYVRSMHGRAINETEKPTGILEPLITYAVPAGGPPRSVRRVQLDARSRPGARTPRGGHREARVPVRGCRAPARTGHLRSGGVLR